MFKKLIIIALMALLITPTAFADRSEKADVIKFNKDTYDVVIQKQDGTMWLLQYNRLCRTFSTEFPVSLIISNQDEITHMKVRVNEQCRVYRSVPYSGELEVNEVIQPRGVQRAEQVNVTWKGIDYELTYGSGCRNLRDFQGELVYLSLQNSSQLIEGRMVLPRFAGQCVIENARPLTTEANFPQESFQLEAPQNIRFEPGNGKITFYWDPINNERFLTHVVAYSRNQLDPSLFDWRQMPHVDTTKNTSYTFRLLDNDRPYYFYFAAMDTSEHVGQWTQMIAQSKPDRRIINDPDLDSFEIELEEHADSYVLYWPSKDDVLRYYVRFYVNGRQKFFNILKSDTTQVVIPKDPAYEGQSLKLTVRARLTKPYDRPYYDGIVWRPEKAN